MKLLRNPIIAASVVLMQLSSTSSSGQQLPSGPQVVTFLSDADDTEQPYGLYLPKNYNPAKKYPLVVMLHGAGSNHRLSLRRVFGKSNATGETDVEATRYFPEWKDVEYIVASPYARGTAGYQGIPEKDVYDVLADVKKRFSIDDDRVYLTGLSMGGGGTLWIGLTRPDIWAAIAPVCPAPPKETVTYSPNALNYPVYFFQGDADPAVKVEGTREWVANLKGLGTSVEYKEYPGVGHNSWENAYADGFIFTWFDKFKRNAFPDRVRFATTRFKYNKAYWVTIDQLTPGTTANVDASFTGPNQITVTTSGLSAITFSLAGHSKFSKNTPLQITVNGTKLKSSGNDRITLALVGTKWTSTAPVVVATNKKLGFEGPIGEAFAVRHVYVYGTGGNPSKEELKARQDVATQASNWSFYRGEFLGRMMFFPRVISDKEVRPSDIESANLILFGTKETNSQIAAVADKMPIQLNATATGYGLFCVFPANNHYVAVSSGLPWWTGVPDNGFPFIPVVQRVLPEFKDYVLFKDALGSKVSEGYFTTSWRLSEADAKKAMDSGAVTVLK